MIAHGFDQTGACGFTTRSNLNQSISQLGSVNNLIQSVAPEIEYNWQSEYTPEYLECLEALRQNTRKIRMELEDIQRSLRSTATRAEQADREAQQALNGK